MATDVENGCGRTMSNRSGDCAASGQGERLDHEAGGQGSSCTHSCCLQVREMVTSALYYYGLYVHDHSIS